MTSGPFIKHAWMAFVLDRNLQQTVHDKHFPFAQIKRVESPNTHNDPVDPQKKHPIFLMSSG